MSDWLETNRERIDELASSLGLEFLGAVELQKESLEFERFKSWIDRNWHAEMHFLRNHLQLREDPRLLEEGACSALIIAMPYSLGDRYEARPSSSRIAQYGSSQGLS